MTIEEIDTLDALRRRLEHSRAIARMVATALDGVTQMVLECIATVLDGICDDLEAATPRQAQA